MNVSSILLRNFYENYVRNQENLSNLQKINYSRTSINFEVNFFFFLKFLQKKDRGYNIAKLYFKVGDYQSAQNWVSLFLEVRNTNAAAHKFLGQCYEKLKKPDRALQAYQRSLQLDPKQTGLITDGNFF